MYRCSISQNLSANSAFMRELNQKAAEGVARGLQDILDDAAKEADRIVNGEMVTDRSGKRRKMGQRHLLGSFDTKLEWDGVGFPVTLTLTSKAERAKVFALEYGARPHVIEPGPGGYLSFPRGAGRSGHWDYGSGSFARDESSARPTSRARGQGYKGGRGGKNFVTQNFVVHPGNRPYRFMERALERAVRKAFGR